MGHDPNNAQPGRRLAGGEGKGVAEANARLVCERLRDDHGPAGIQCRQRGGTVPTVGHESQPPVVGEVLAHDRGRLLAQAGEGHTEESYRRDRLHAGEDGDLVADRIRGGDGPDRGEKLAAGDRVGQPGSADLANVLDGRAQGHDHRQSDDQRAGGEGRAAGVAGQRAACQTLLVAEDAERDSDKPEQRPQDSRHDQDRGQQQAVQDERAPHRRVDGQATGASGLGGRGGTLRPDGERRQCQNTEDERQPAQPSAGDSSRGAAT